MLGTMRITTLPQLVLMTKEGYRYMEGEHTVERMVGWLEGVIEGRWEGVGEGGGMGMGLGLGVGEDWEGESDGERGEGDGDL